MSPENDAHASALVVTQAAKLTLGGLFSFVVVVLLVVVVLIPVVIRGGPI